MTKKIDLLKQEERVIKAETKYESEVLKQDKFKDMQKEKQAKKWESVKKMLSKPVTVKSVMKKNQMSLTLKERTPENVFSDENRFFKGNFEKEKRSMFLE